MPEIETFLWNNMFDINKSKKTWFPFLFYFNRRMLCWINQIRNFRSQAKNDYIDKIREIILNSIM